MVKYLPSLTVAVAMLLVLVLWLVAWCFAAVGVSDSLAEAGEASGAGAYLAWTGMVFSLYWTAMVIRYVPPPLLLRSPGSCRCARG